MIKMCSKIQVFSHQLCIDSIVLSAWKVQSLNITLFHFSFILCCVSLSYLYLLCVVCTAFLLPCIPSLPWIFFSSPEGLLIKLEVQHGLIQVTHSTCFSL